MIGLTKAAQSSESVIATGSLDVMRYGEILKARRLVGLRGVGDAFDGLYYVRSVTSKIKRGEFKQTSLSAATASSQHSPTYPNE